MILVKPSAEIMAMTPDPLGLIERAGRTCYKSEDKIGVGSAEKFATMILKRGHESVIEHASATVRFVVDRGVSHEIVRHRLASYSQESTRYCDYQDGHVCFVIPGWCYQVQPGVCGSLSQIELEDRDQHDWFCAMLIAEEYYKKLRAWNWRPEQARSVLPNSLKTEVVMTANFREWRHFFRLRISAAAHPQMREVVFPLLVEFQRLVPVLFDDLEAK